MKLLITETLNFSKKAIAILENKFQITILEIKSKEELLEIISDYDALFIRLKFKIDKKIIEKSTSLKYILTATTGLDHIDVDFFESSGGIIISLKEEFHFLESIPSTAEHTWALLLSLIKKIPSSFESVKKGNWNRNLYINNNLKGKKIGILGMGRVGKQVANFANAFGMEIGFFDTNHISNNFIKFDSANELFKWSNIISIHIPNSTENKNYVNKSLLSNIQKGTILINTSRGAIWDEIEIALMLKNETLLGLATDVLKDELESENILSNPFVILANQNYNVIITPHIAGASIESMELTEIFIANKILKILN